jgi:hypothetical protein
VDLLPLCGSIKVGAGPLADLHPHLIERHLPVGGGRRPRSFAPICGPNFSVTVDPSCGFTSKVETFDRSPDSTSRCVDDNRCALITRRGLAREIWAFLAGCGRSSTAGDIHEFARSGLVACD